MLELFMKPDRIECGIDEVGAGCLAGPVTISAVIWPNCFDSNHREMLELIKDSKKLSEKKRYFLRDFIQEHALAYSIIDIDNNKIDEINILQARLIGFHKAIDELDIIPEHIIVDGDRFRIYTDKTGNVVPDTKVLDGDNKYQSIAAASILAKCHRDDYMKKIHLEYPIYSWEKNKGYGTQEHRNQIQDNGITPYHRKTFGICKTKCL
jgi:ribonuclease HII